MNANLTGNIIQFKYIFKSLFNNMNRSLHLYVLVNYCYADLI